MTSVHDARLVPAAGAAWVAVAVTLSGAPAWWIGALIASAGASTVAAVVGRGSVRAVAVVAAFALAVGAVVSMLTGARLEQRAGDPFLEHVDGGDVTAWVRLTHEPRERPGGAGMLGRGVVDRWHSGTDPNDDGWHESAMPVLVAWTTAEQQAEGAVGSPSGSSPVHGYEPAGPERAEPERFDSVLIVGAVSKLDDAHRIGVFWDAHLIDIAPSEGLVADVRRQFVASADAAPDGGRGVLIGMVLGDTSRMSTAEEEAMRVSGLAHLTAVSGAHFAILTLAVSVGMAAVRAPRAVRAAVVAIAAAAFAVLVGPQPSVLRALGMATVIALGLAWGRRARALPALAATIIVLTLVDPWTTLEIGFAMSVSAVLAIVLGAPRIAALAQRAVTPGLATLMSIPVAAQLAVSPLIASFDPGTSLVAIPANLLAGPFVLPTTLLGIGAAVVGFAHAPAGGMVAAVAGWCAVPIGWIADVTARMPGAWWDVPDPPVGAWWLTAVALAVTVLAWRRPGAAARWVAGAGLVAMVLVLAVHGGRAAVPGEWSVVACDVGQGDMLVLRAGPHHGVVIDTGPPGVAAAECLRDLGVREVPLLVLTHPHDDHDGGTSGLLDVAAVGRAWVPRIGIDSPAARELTERGVPVAVPEEGTVWSADAVDIQVVSRLHLSEGVAENDASIVVRAEASGVSVLALGDLEPPGQADLHRRLGRQVTVDSVKVAHHGSRHQDAQLAESIRASVALFSAGANNRHGHPTAEALDLYAHAGLVLRTDECGHVALWRAGSGSRDGDGRGDAGGALMTASACGRGMAP